MDGLKKEAKITVVDEPRLKPITDENIAFYNMDINTAVLTSKKKLKVFHKILAISKQHKLISLRL